EADDGTQPVAAIFGEIDGGKDAQGDRERRSQADQHEAADDGIGQPAARLADWFGQLGEEIPIESQGAAKDQIAEDEQEDTDGGRQAETEHAGHEDVDKPSVTRAV